MTITYKIQNVAADLVHTVMLRKFFQMVFVGKDRKSLSIYTATVLGGQGDDPTSKNVSESSSLPNTWKIKNILSKTKPFNLLQEIDIFLDMTDEHGRGNRQFVLSIFISFALAFGIDSSRLAAVKNFFPFPNTVEADAWWLLLLVFLSMNLFIRPPQAENMRWHFFWRKINILSCLTWAVCVFIVFKIKPVHHYLTLTVPNICLIMEWIYAALLVSTGIYAVYNIFKYHDPIISSIFDDDIL